VVNGNPPDLSWNNNDGFEVGLASPGWASLAVADVAVAFLAGYYSAVVSAQEVAARGLIFSISVTTSGSMIRRCRNA
jgi:hypothetical protein